MALQNSTRHMSRQEIRDIASEVLDLDLREISDEADFYDDLAADSLQMIELAVRLERQSGIRLTSEEAADLSCLRDAFAVLLVRGITLAD